MPKWWNLGGHGVVHSFLSLSRQIGGRTQGKKRHGAQSFSVAGCEAEFVGRWGDAAQGKQAYEAD